MSRSRSDQPADRFVQRELVEPAFLRIVGDLIHQRDRIAVILEHRLVNGGRRFVRFLRKHDFLRRDSELARRPP